MWTTTSDTFASGLVKWVWVALQFPYYLYANGRSGKCDVRWIVHVGEEVKGFCNKTKVCQLEQHTAQPLRTHSRTDVQGELGNDSRTDTIRFEYLNVSILFKNGLKMIWIAYWRTIAGSTRQSMFERIKWPNSRRGYDANLREHWEDCGGVWNF